MLNKYQKTIDDLSDIEKYLFEKNLKQLEAALNPLITSYNLNSLGINDFIAKYLDKLKKFNEVKNKVDEKKRLIEDTIEKIEKTKLIKDDQIKNIMKN